MGAPKLCMCERDINVYVYLYLHLRISLSFSTLMSSPSCISSLECPHVVHVRKKHLCVCVSLSLYNNVSTIVHLVSWVTPPCARANKISLSLSTKSTSSFVLNHGCPRNLCVSETARSRNIFVVSRSLSTLSLSTPVSLLLGVPREDIHVYGHLDSYLH